MCEAGTVMKEARHYSTYKRAKSPEKVLRRNEEAMIIRGKMGSAGRRQQLF
jgi:hypothetical protein